MKEYWNTFNDYVAEKITKSVGTMLCAYIFAIIALMALPQALHDSFATGFQPMPFVIWLSQSFLQLVLLSVILVGQDIQSRNAEVRSVDQYRAVMETLNDIRQLVTQGDEELVDLHQIGDQLARIEGLVTPRSKLAAIFNKPT